MMRFSSALRFCVGLLLGCLISVAVPALWPDAGVTAPPSDASMLAQSSEPDVLLRQGRTAYEAGEMASAVQQLQGAAQAYGERGEPLNQAIALNYLSLAQQQQGQWREAEAVIKESLDLIGVPSATARD
ncbi:tetratricopeptide repeat protein, partial [Geitlerinema sp. P-1104]|uniref:tetratricopeptide repeat protein n=1 Tax=Geitlerinema sp. P-1104 TaxID=2546230 RepID=UPI001476DDC5